MKTFQNIKYFNTSFYPIPFDRYFLIVIENNGYKFWSEVISLIRPVLNKQNIEIVVAVDSAIKYNCYTIRNLSIPQLIYACQNSVGHTGCDENSKYFSDKFLDFSELQDDRFSDIQCKFGNKNPCHIASLICGEKFNHILYLGCNYVQNFIEFVPTSKIDLSYNVELVLRLDKGGTASNALGRAYNSLIFNSYSQFDSKLFDSSSKIYAIVDNISLTDIKDIIDNRWSFICTDKNILNKKRCEFIDFKIFLSDNSRRGVLKNKDLSDAFCTSNRKIYKDGAYYNSYAHMKKGLTFTETFDIIDCNDFWESQDFLRILKK